MNLVYDVANQLFADVLIFNDSKILVVYSRAVMLNPNSITSISLTHLRDTWNGYVSSSR